MCVCVCVRECVCVNVFECACERERECVCVCVCVCVWERERESVCVCLSEWVSMCVCVCERVCVCVRVCVCERVWVCMWERESVCVCVWVSERVCVNRKAKAIQVILNDSKYPSAPACTNSKQLVQKYYTSKCVPERPESTLSALIDYSPLPIMMKIEAIRLIAIAKIQHLIMNVHIPQCTLSTLNDEMVKLVRKWLCLNSHTTRDIIFQSRRRSRCPEHWMDLYCLQNRSSS